MKKQFVALLLLLCLTLNVGSYSVYFKEQYYKLYHTHYIQYPDDTIENIYYLEQAQKADFCNPLYALAKIEDKKQWERYRYLFNMHIELKLIEQHLRLGSKYDKRNAYFYNAPWKEENLKSLEIAETSYKAALYYWPRAKEWAEKAEKIRWTPLPDIQFWEDEATRIVKGELDYEKIITEELERVQKVKKEFESMDNTY